MPSFVSYLVVLCIISHLILDGSAATTDCGVPAIKPKASYITGGIEADENTWPWMVYLEADDKKGDTSYCGASIISNQWVLTAAHCVSDMKNVRIYLGKHHFDQTDLHEVKFNIAKDKITIHQSYNPNTADADIALLDVGAGNIHFSNYISPVCLASQDVAVGTTCTTTGWGKYKENIPPPNGELRQVQIEINKPSDCPRGVDDISEICAGEKGKGACKGDSGGPLLFDNGGVYYQQGVTSCYGGKCECGAGPQVYVRVCCYRAWIEKISGVTYANGEQHAARTGCDCTSTSKGTEQVRVPQYIVGLSSFILLYLLKG